MTIALSINGLSKKYKPDFQALSKVSLEIKQGEIFALLGPNGAGKTTLISIVCGIVNPSEGEIRVNNCDIQKDYRKARQQIGLVPQELSLSMFESVWATVNFSRGMYGKPRDDKYLEDLLRKLSLWEKKDSRIMALSGGMKRRVLIAKALSHQPDILFLDEPTAGVDVELRQEMWAMIRELRDTGVTVILTTHYIDEAEEMADRIGIINKGKIVLVNEKQALMKKLGSKQLSLELSTAIPSIPSSLANYKLELLDDGHKLTYTFNSQDEHNQIPALLKSLEEQGIEFKDLHTSQSSLEDIFVSLVGGAK
ncbi:ABC-2 type transport system ATP-binding protein [Alteromonadaceae bacterium Bs31]|nr:ABC-2 type transport system ATP-binding protein [Alteromonadaceae bacterium Bs31]